MPASADEKVAELSQISCRYPEPLLLRNWSAMSTNVMRSLRFSEFGPPSVLRIEEVAIPEPGVGEALVQVKAAAIKPSDIGDVAGRFKSTTLPRTPGRDLQALLQKASIPQVLRSGAVLQTSVSSEMDLTPNMSLSRRRRCRSNRSR